MEQLHPIENYYLFSLVIGLNGLEEDCLVIAAYTPSNMRRESLKPEGEIQG